MTEPPAAWPAAGRRRFQTVALLALFTLFGLVFGVMYTSALSDGRPRLYEASAETVEALEPEFQRYLKDGPTRTGRLPLPGGGSVPIEEFDWPRDSGYYLIPLAKVEGPPAYHWWQLGDGWEIRDYKPGYQLVGLDPMLAGRLMHRPRDLGARPDPPPAPAE